MAMELLLTHQERETLKARHKVERDKRVCDRIKAVLLSDEGWSYRQIAHVLLLSEDAVQKHINDFQLLKKLHTENGGSASRLSASQAADIEKHLREHTYLHAKDIVAYVKATYGVEYTVAGMTNWLTEHGFSYKKPAVVPGKANREAQKAWIEEYQKLKANLKNDEAICFIDGVHPTHNPKPTYGWIKRGENKELLSNTGRQRINLSGSIDIVSRKVIVREDETLDAISTIAFLKKIEESYPLMNRIYVFCDNAGYYRNKNVTEYLKTSKIEMRFLPPYSPNLNPIERLWKLMYELIMYNKYYEKFQKFRDEVLAFLEGLSDPPKALLDILRSRITDNFHIVGSKTTAS